jgi:hypothetical protein
LLVFSIRFVSDRASSADENLLTRRELRGPKNIFPQRPSLVCYRRKPLDTTLAARSKEYFTPSARASSANGCLLTRAICHTLQLLSYFIQSLTLPDFALQVFGLDVDPDRWKDRPINEITAEYYLFFHDWIQTYFGDLKSLLQWERLYIHLVEKVVKLTSISSERSIDTDQVLVPPPPDIFNVCRLLLQALGGLRNAVADGQHRIAGMVRLLFGDEIVWNGRMKPPLYFSYERTHGGCLQQSFVPTTESDTERLSSILSRMCGEASVRIFVPSEINEFESDSVRYSLVRSESQSKTKARVLSDV